MSDTLALLTNIISTNVDSIQTAYTAHNSTFPSLDTPGIDSALNPATTDPEVAQSINAIIAAAAQLIATVRRPELTIVEASTAVRDLELSFWVW